MPVGLPPAPPQARKTDESRHSHRGKRKADPHRLSLPLDIISNVSVPRIAAARNRNRRWMRLLSCVFSMLPLPRPIPAPILRPERIKLMHDPTNSQAPNPECSVARARADGLGPPVEAVQAEELGDVDERYGAVEAVVEDEEEPEIGVYLGLCWWGGG